MEWKEHSEAGEGVPGDDDGRAELAADVPLENGDSRAEEAQPAAVERVRVPANFVPTILNQAYTHLPVLTLILLEVTGNLLSVCSNPAPSYWLLYANIFNAEVHLVQQ